MRLCSPSSVASEAREIDLPGERVVDDQLRLEPVRVALRGGDLLGQELDRGGVVAATDGDARGPHRAVGVAAGLVEHRGPRHARLVAVRDGVREHVEQREPELRRERDDLAIDGHRLGGPAAVEEALEQRVVDVAIVGELRGERLEHRDATGVVEIRDVAEPGEEAALCLVEPAAGERASISTCAGSPGGTSQVSAVAR